MNQIPRALLRQKRLPFAHRSLSTLPSRHLSQHIAQHGRGPIRVQAVRLGKPNFFQDRRVALKRLATILLYGGATYVYFEIVARYLEIEVEVDENDDQDGREGEGEGAEHEHGPPFYADEESFFIPMTWATKLPKTWYRGSDPEWQEFTKFARNLERRKQVTKELVQLVYTGTAKHPSIAKELGKDTKLGRCWTDITFPDGPPQEYQRSGLEIGDGFIAWSQQKVTPENHFRLMRAIWPEAALSSLWASTKVLAGIQYRRVQQMLGLAEVDPKSPEERYRVALEMMAKQQQGKQQKTADADGASSTNGGADDSKRLPWQLSVPMPNQMVPDGNDLPIATHIFRNALARNWGNKKPEPPRGTFTVQAFVEIIGQKSRVLFDCQGFYDPKASRFVFVQASLRQVKQLAQSPKGGS